jgi:hypothetical protein
MLLEVSTGEAIDKLSILEIKKDRITHPEKQLAIQQELLTLDSIVKIKERYSFEYAFLTKINEEIWDLTETLNPTDPKFADISERIFELNRKRFRVKRLINTAENSTLKEQKSFGDKHCLIELDLDPYMHIPELYSVVFDYDTFSFDRPCKLRPFLNFLDSTPKVYTKIPISSLTTRSEIKSICYGSGGRLGDTLHQLSIVNETYLKTGRKGIVYLSDTLGDPFDRGVESTFNDIHDIIKDQPYIQSLHIHNGESIDINLSQWRGPQFSYTQSWKQTFQETFNIPWNDHPWISTIPNLQYKDTTFLSVGNNRYNHVLSYHEMYKKIDNLVFLATNQEMYDTFVSKTGLRIPYLICPTFSDLASVIMGCKGIIGSLSMPLALADSMWKPRLGIMFGTDLDNCVAMLTDKRHIMYTEHLVAFGWQTPMHPNIERMDLVLQGPADSHSLEIAEHYLQLDFVNKIIISCWEKDNIYTQNPRIQVIKNVDVDAGYGNRNRQVKSSLEGLKRVTTQFSAKLRSDQKISLDSMNLMFAYYNRHKERELQFYDDASKPRNKICVAGIYKPFPFHPRDHIYWGNTEDLIDVFTIPMCTGTLLPDYDYTKITRCETYISVYYYARFEPKINKFIENKQLYLVDNAPHVSEAFEINDRIITKVFKPFPRIDFTWKKYNMTGYHYWLTEKSPWFEYWGSEDD